MFIKYDELELLEFFENEPTAIGEDEAENFIYTHEDDGFKIIMYISTYEKYITLSITYNDNLVYSQKHCNISEIKKIDSNNLKVSVNIEKEIYIKKSPQIGVVIE